MCSHFSIATSRCEPRAPSFGIIRRCQRKKRHACTRRSHTPKPRLGASCTVSWRGREPSRTPKTSPHRRLRRTPHASTRTSGRSSARSNRHDTAQEASCTSIASSVSDLPTAVSLRCKALSDDEQAFYDAQETNGSALKVLGVAVSTLAADSSLHGRGRRMTSAIGGTFLSKTILDRPARARGGCGDSEDRNLGDRHGNKGDQATNNWRARGRLSPAAVRHRASA